MKDQTAKGEEQMLKMIWQGNTIFISNTIVSGTKLI